MDVSNGTGEDTQYRTGSGTTKAVAWTALPPKGILHCADPTGSWTIFFRVHDGRIFSETFTESMAAVALVKNGSTYRITVTKKTDKKPARPAKAKPTKAKTAA